MFKIGDFSRLAQVSVRMLRHYDKLGLLKPNHTDQWTGYRYYMIDQLPRLNRIVALNGLGVTLQQISALLDQDELLSAEALRGMLLIRQAELAQEVVDKQAQLAEVAARLQQIDAEGRPSPYEPILKALDPLTIASIRDSVPTIDQVSRYCREIYGLLYDQLRHSAIEPLYPEIILYHNEDYREADLDIEFTVAVDRSALAGRRMPAEGLLIRELPGCELAATLAYRGLYRDIGPAVLALMSWIGTQGHAMVGALREVHRSGPAHIDGVLQEPAILELQIPVARLRPGVEGVST